MLKKVIITSIILVLVAALAACSGISLPGVAAAAPNSSNGSGNGTSGQQQRAGNQFDPSKMPVQQKLAIGILKLEGTSLAVTPAQAKTLLPLWQALESLSTNNNTTTDEINALFQQMQDALTPDQVTAITKMTWQQSDMQSLAQQYGIQFAQGGSNLTPAERATRVAQFQAQGGGNGGTGARTGGGGGGVFFGGGGGGGGGFGGGGFGGATNGGTRPTLTPQQQAQFAARRSLGGLNRIFAPAVIKLLQTKAGA